MAKIEIDMTRQPESNASTMATRRFERSDYFFLSMNIALLSVLPLLTAGVEHWFDRALFQWTLVSKWFVFWAVGIRLFAAGIRQASDPEFTGKKIFGFRSEESFVVIRELGFANMALGAMGILSLINDQWRVIAAIAGGLFFGLAAAQHTLRTSKGSAKENIAFAYDLIVFILLGLFAVLCMEGWPGATYY